MKKLMLVLCVLMAGQGLAYASEEPAAPAAGDAAKGKEKSMTCAACHGPDGNSMIAEYPKIAGQHADYIATQLQDFKAGTRQNALMSPMAMPLSEQDMLDLAAYYSSQTMTLGAADESLLAEGELIYRAGLTDKGVPACIGCHGPAGNGNGPALYPRIGGQSAAYVEKQLNDYKTGVRAANSEVNIHVMMRQISMKLSAEEMKAVASYVSGLH
jgi:cytochrome c553